MKKLIFSILIIFLCLTSFALISCGEKTSEFNITYKLNGGANSEENPSGYNAGDTITLDYPEKADYMFAGWYTDSAFTTEIKEIKDREENLTLYAKWIPVEEVFELSESNGEYKICTTLKKDVSTIIIPSSYNGLSITELGEDAFSECASLENIVISNSIISISDKTFLLCPSLKQIKVEEDNSVYKSLDGVLYTKNGKVLLVYPAGKTEKSFDIPYGTEIVAEKAFYKNPYIADVNISNSVKEIGFNLCTAIESIKLPESVVKINGFYRCLSLKNISLSSNIETIPTYAFQDCTSLESIVIPNGIKKMGSMVFYRCLSLKSVVIPKSVTYVEYSIFEGCTSIDKVYCEAESKPNGWYDSWDSDIKEIVWGHKESNK